MHTSLQKIEDWLTKKGEASFRIDQIKKAWYQKKSWEDVTTLSKDLRIELEKYFPWTSITESKVYTSRRDGTKKALLTLKDDTQVEAVFMPNARGKRTVCISSQVGCAMACSFCATGKMGLVRNLTIDEIVDQVRFWKMHEKEQISNVVFMGMGEPLANYDAVKEVCRILIEIMDIGATRITVSTVGAPAGLKKMLIDDDFPAVRLALSLHAGTDEIRESIVPSHRFHTMKTLAAWITEYLEKKGNRRHHMTIEYVMLQDINDMLSEAQAVGKLFGRFQGKVRLNLIPWNPTGDTMERSSEDHLEAFREVTERMGLPTTIRYSKGLDIDAACGQLANKDVS